MRIQKSGRKIYITSIKFRTEAINIANFLLWKELQYKNTLSIIDSKKTVLKNLGVTTSAEEMNENVNPAAL